MDNNGLAAVSIVLLLLAAIRSLLLNQDSSLGSALFAFFLFWLGVTVMLAISIGWTLAILIMVGVPITVLLIFLVYGRTPTDEDPDTHKHT